VVLLPSADHDLRKQLIMGATVGSYMLVFTMCCVIFVAAFRLVRSASDVEIQFQKTIVLQTLLKPCCAELLHVTKTYRYDAPNMLYSP
jgi:hypothetical protein